MIGESHNVFDKPQQQPHNHNYHSLQHSQTAVVTQQQPLSTQVLAGPSSCVTHRHHACAQDQGRMGSALGRAWGSGSNVKSDLQAKLKQLRTASRKKGELLLFLEEMGMKVSSNMTISQLISKRGTDPQPVRARGQRDGGLREAWRPDICPGDGSTPFLHPVGDYHRPGVGLTSLAPETTGTMVQSASLLQAVDRNPP